MKTKLRIGRKDKADFPALALQDIAVKVDTGAYTSAIHCHRIEVRTVDGVDTLHFQLLDPEHPQTRDREFTTTAFKRKSIKSSNAVAELRYIIQTEIELFERVFPIQLSLSRRGEMRFPVLIGRRFLMGNFIVDPSKYDLSYKAKKKAATSLRT